MRRFEYSERVRTWAARCAELRIDHFMRRASSGLKYSGWSSYEMSWMTTTARHGLTGGITYWKWATSTRSRRSAQGKTRGMRTRG
jgi:hypothetical protein